jgi:hypothetical protein
VPPEAGTDIPSPLPRAPDAVPSRPLPLPAPALPDGVPVPVRVWRSGVLDRVVALLVLPWGGEALSNVSGVLLLVVTLVVPPGLVWRVTADSTGLWCTGWVRVHHVGWDEIRTVGWEKRRLLIGGRWTRFPDRKLLFVRAYLPKRRVPESQPGALAAAEITAMWRDPARRPTVASAVRRRGRPVWSLVVPLAVSWAAALVILG